MMVKAVGKTIAALAAVLIAVNGARLVTVPGRVLIGAILTSAVLAAVTTSASSWGEWRSRRAGIQRASAEFQLTSTLWAIVDQAGPAHPLDYRDLGLAVYRRRRRWWPPFGVRLIRQHRVRASRRPGASDVVWSPGKGVIGSCVSSGKLMSIDIAELYGSLGDPSADDWGEAPVDVTMGLSYAEYLDLRDKYEVVVALPMTDELKLSTRVSGCIALDGPAGRPSEDAGVGRGHRSAGQSRSRTAVADGLRVESWLRKGIR